MAARGLVSALWLSSGSLSVCCAPRLRSFSPPPSRRAAWEQRGGVRVGWRRAVLSRRSGSRLALCRSAVRRASVRSLSSRRLGHGVGLRLDRGARSSLGALALVWLSVGLLCAAPPFVLSRRAAWNLRGGIKVALRRAVLSRRSGSRLALCRSAVRRASVRSHVAPLGSTGMGLVCIAARGLVSALWLSSGSLSVCCAPRLRCSLCRAAWQQRGGLGLGFPITFSRWSTGWGLGAGG